MIPARDSKQARYSRQGQLQRGATLGEHTIGRLHYLSLGTKRPEATARDNGGAAIGEHTIKRLPALSLEDVSLGANGQARKPGAKGGNKPEGKRPGAKTRGNGCGGQRSGDKKLSVYLA